MQCPGQDNRYWDGEAVFEVSCPHCGNELEFFKDDSQRSCKKCGNRVLNPRIDFGCAAYCSHAEQCLGAMPPELLAKQKNLFKDKLSLAVRKQFVGREELFKKACLCTEIAEKLCKEEQRGDMAAVLAAALLLDIETPGALLEELKADPKMIAAVNRLLGHQPPDTDEEQASADIFNDACLLTELQSAPQTQANPSFRTASGSKVSKEL
ncbi:MAG: phosphohydrolase [Proteobacteria bacterium]|nr:phosphohydrolase [Pseudomonadota bacterium]MBU1232998.1 phosphohydrolase [Pseudomonadota bacterium]MBU1418672.1 phosphohydrolase [Pseudomonadota bacterium]MBU1456791.1 phosphohydrolase [Pseudomonadota bacterium]